MRTLPPRLALACLLLLGPAADLLAQQRTTRTTTGRRTTGSGVGGSARDYPNNTQLGDALIQIDPETRSLVVVTDEDTNLEIGRIIQSLDRPKPQVLIKVFFLEVTYSEGFDFGLEGSLSYIHDNINEGTLESVWGLAQQPDGGFWTMSADFWNTTLRAIAEDGKLEVLSRPSILARNNQEAVIIVGEEVPLVTSSRVLDDGNTLNTVQYSDVGIILRVTPFITSNDSVEMIVAPEISTLTDRGVPISDTASSPVIAKRSAETVVVTPNGQTVVIGGLMESQKIETVRKIPFLGDIPLLGHAFKRTIQEEIKKELLIFLTPYIVNDAAALAEASAREVDVLNMADRAFPEEELDKYLDGDLKEHFGRRAPPQPEPGDAPDDVEDD